MVLLWPVSVYECLICACKSVCVSRWVGRCLPEIAELSQAHGVEWVGISESQVGPGYSREVLESLPTVLFNLNIETHSLGFLPSN